MMAKVTELEALALLASTTERLLEVLEREHIELEELERAKAMVRRGLAWAEEALP